MPLRCMASSTGQVLRRSVTPASLLVVAPAGYSLVGHHLSLPCGSAGLAGTQDFVRIQVVGQVQRHQRREVRAGWQGCANALRVGQCLLPPW
jgi:hypothetical protein